MKSSSQLGRKKAAVGIGAVLLLAASLVTVSATLNAQTNDCSGDQTVGFGTQYFGTGNFGNHLLSINNADGGTVLAPVAVNLPAGTYDINAVSTDGYVGRDTVSQPNEQWIADFRDASGNVLASTSATGDVADLVEQGYWTGSIGSIALSADAVDVVVRHAFPGTGNTPNSVRPVCLGITDTTPAPVAVDPCADAAADGSDGATDADGNACVDPCGDAAADGSDGATDADGNACVDPCGDAAADGSDGATDADGNACVDPCEAALVAVGVSAEAAAEACGADTPEQCVDIAVENENNAEATAPEACGVETGTEGTGDACIDALVAEGATVDGATTACGSDTAEACVAAAVDAGADQAAAEEACNGITVEVGGETVTNEENNADNGDGDGDDDDDDGNDTEVLGATITAPVAQAQTGDPTFTG